MSSKSSSSSRALTRVRAVASLVVAVGALAGCNGSHLNAIPGLPAQPAQGTVPVASALAQYRATSHRLQVVSGHLRPEMLRAPLVGNLPLRQKLHLAIGLPLRDRAASRALLDAVSNPQGNNYRRYLTPAEFQSRFSPTSNDYQSAIGFAQAAGFTVTRTYPGRVVIEVEASVATIQRALHLTMQTRRRPDGSLFYAPSNEPAVALATPILHIAGLDNEQVPVPTLASVFPARSGGARERMQPEFGSGPGGLFAGSDFRNAYATNATQTGAGQCVGLLEIDSSFFPSDIAAYQNEFSLPPLAPQPILLDGYNGQPVVGTGEQETALDIEVSQAMAPGLSNILVYEGSFADSIFAAMTSGQLCSQLSASWTFPVDPTAQQLVDQMALQGQSFYVSSGDGGGYAKDTRDDRDLSNTAVVGGTELTLNADFRWKSETAWPGSGGGVEKKEYKPPFQHGVKIVRGATPKSRLVPDVAMVAANVFLIADQGQLYSVTGTSISTPLWAGYTSLINQLAMSAGQPALGFPDPPLYAVATNSGLYTTNFHDITSGNNGPFSALPKYDLVTGWGSPQPGLIATLNPSPAANFTQLQIIVYTGSDDLRNDSDLQVAFQGVGNLTPFCLMRSNNGKPSGFCTGNVYGDVNGLQGWPGWSTQTLNYTNRFANWTWSGGGTMTLTLTNHNNGLETNDNWDVQALSVTLSNPLTSQSVTLFDSGDFNAPHNAGTCYWRFKPAGSPPTVKQAFNLLPGTTPSNGCPDDGFP
ncbi:MAG: S53 family peptidase [Candidatus Tumulicola sp.]